MKGIKQFLLTSEGARGADHERETGREAAGYRLDGEDLIAVWPDQAAKDSPGLHIDGMYTAEARIDLQAWSVPAKTGDHARGPDESDAIAHA
jgi:hypothetical protein